MNNLEIILVCLVLALNLILGGIVFIRGPRKRANQLFAAMVLSIIIWVPAYFLENYGFSEQTSLLFLRTDFVFAGVVSYFWLIFCMNFPEDGYFKNKFYPLYLGLAPLIFGLLAFTNLVVTNFRIINGVIIFDRGFLYFLYVAFIFFYMFGGCFIMFYRYKRVERVMQRQIIYILIGALLTLITVIFITLILPQILEISVNIARLGIYGILFLVGFTAYAITKHQLFGIRVILTETATVIVVLTFFIQTLLSKTVSQGFINGLILIMMTYGGYLLIKSVQQEIKKREQLESLSQQLTQANEQLQEDKKRLVEIDRMKDEFLQMATHELNTPIAVIEGKSSMIMDEDMGGFTPEQKKFLRSITDNSTRLAHLAKDMLNVTRIDQKRLTLVKSEANLVEMASKIVADLQFKAKKKNDTLTFEKPSQFLPKFFVDQTKIAEVFNNLIINAIKFTQDGTIIVKIEPKDGEVIVSVKDTGIGISKEDQTQLFEKFHQIGRFDHQSPVEQQGTGLGLYISKKLIELHQGRIWLESELNKGTTFYFSLPINHQKDKAQNG